MATLSRFSDALDEHTLESGWNRYRLLTGEWVHECNGGCAEDLIQRLKAKGVVLTESRPWGENHTEEDDEDDAQSAAAS